MRRAFVGDRELKKRGMPFPASDIVSRFPIQPATRRKLSTIDEFIASGKHEQAQDLTKDLLSEVIDHRLKAFLQENMNFLEKKVAGQPSETTASSAPPHEKQADRRSSRAPEDLEAKFDRREKEQKDQSPLKAKEELKRPGLSDADYKEFFEQFKIFLPSLVASLLPLLKNFQDSGGASFSTTELDSPLKETFPQQKELQTPIFPSSGISPALENIPTEEVRQDKTGGQFSGNLQGSLQGSMNFSSESFSRLEEILNRIVDRLSFIVATQQSQSNYSPSPGETTVQNSTAAFSPNESGFASYPMPSPSASFPGMQLPEISQKLGARKKDEQKLGKRKDEGIKSNMLGQKKTPEQLSAQQAPQFSPPIMQLPSSPIFMLPPQSALPKLTEDPGEVGKEGKIEKDEKDEIKGPQSKGDGGESAQTPETQPLQPMQPETQRMDSSSSPKDDEPRIIQGVLRMEKEAESPYIKLTYDFNKLPYDYELARDNQIFEYAYYKYKPMLQKAWEFVRKRQLKKALNYYRTIIDQPIPEELRAMIMVNIKDITQYMEKYLRSNFQVRYFRPQSGIQGAVNF